MSCERVPAHCKQRFKGVESFLRRVAFNLGNSPSQTEVKIISCIPIDVTDLQQKIINLEKELDLARAKKPCNTTVQQAFFRRKRSCSSNADAPPACLPPACLPPACPPPACPPPACLTPACLPPACPPLSFCGSEPPRAPPPPPPSPTNRFVECACWPSECSIVYRDSTEPTELFEATESKKGFFKRSKKKKKASCSCNTQFVYYSQTENSPFGSYENHKSPINNKAPKPSKESISRTYISDMVHKQYTAAPIPEEYSITSEFSSPVCRDASPGRAPRAPALTRAPARCGSDMCSCCHGPFHNIDFYTTNKNHSYVNTTDFYDSSLYDMVPVKEKPIKPPSLYYDTPQKKLVKNYMDSSHFPERNRQKYRYHPFIVNHSKVPAGPYKKSLKLVNKNEKYRRVVEYPKREAVTRKVDRYYDEGSLRSSSIDCGRVYMKKLHTSVKAPSAAAPVVSVTYKNAECLTTSVYDTECQTTTTQSEYAQIGSDLYEDKKTEDTLNQIKVILQSVLTEVKTNTQVKNKPEIKPTKDAVVQKEISQDATPGCSSMPNCYNYNMNPFNMASCSRQINSGACCYPNLPYASGKCLQNFPVFIQTPGRNICSSCYQNSAHVTKGSNPRQAGTTATATATTTTAAATAATTTDVAKKDHSKETEKLIKEIYKSIAVNMEFPTKNTSASEYGGAKSTPRSSFNKSLIRGSFQDERVKVAMKSNSTSTKAANVEKSTTPLSTMNSKLTSNKKSLRSQTLSATDTERCLRINRIESYLDDLESQKSKHNKIEEEYEAATPSTSEEDSYSDYESELTPSRNPTKKPNLFSKVFQKSVKLFSPKQRNERSKKREEQVQVQSEEDESEAVSDDYQTMYSHRESRQRGHSKVSLSRRARDRLQDEYRRSSYLEQEYKRHWNEKPMFNEYHRDSETPRSRDTDPRQRANPSYYRNYDARSALVQHNQRSALSKVMPLRILSKATGPKVNVASKGLSWLKKHKPGIHCGEQWKKFILEG